MKLDNIRNIYLLGDLHIGVRNNSSEWFDIQREFLLDWFIPKILEDGFDPEHDILIQLGDWNHVRESENIRISDASLEIFDEFSKTFKRGFHIILGNHDVYYKDRTDIHSLKKIDRIYDNLKVYETPEILQINGNHRFLMMPWEHDSSELSRKVSTMGSSADYLICHADIKNAKFNKWTTLDHGLEKSDLDLFKKTYAGHIHIRQEHYVGTPYQLDRGDRNNIKGFYKLNVEGDEIIETFYENTISPKFVKFDIQDILNKSIDEINELFRNNFVDIAIENDIANFFPVTQFVELVGQSNHRSIEFFPHKSDGFDVDSVELDDNSDYNLFDVLGEYLTAREIPNSLSEKVSSKFKEVHDEIKNSKNYYE